MQTCRSHHEGYCVVGSRACHWRCLYPSLQKKRSNEAANHGQAPLPWLWEEVTNNTATNVIWLTVVALSTTVQKRLEAAWSTTERGKWLLVNPNSPWWEELTLGISAIAQTCSHTHTPGFPSSPKHAVQDPQAAQAWKDPCIAASCS